MLNYLERNYYKEEYKLNSFMKFIFNSKFDWIMEKHKSIRHIVIIQWILGNYLRQETTNFNILYNICVIMDCNL